MVIALSTPGSTMLSTLNVDLLVREVQRAHTHTHTNSVFD